MTDTTDATAPADGAAERIRAAGLKVTAGRVAVWRALAAAPHADAEQVFAQVKTELPGTSLQSVYGILAAFTAAGLVRRIEPARSAARYERRIGDNHHHVVCTGCGAVGDVDCVVGEAPCLTPSNTGGFTVQTAEVTFWGVCPACQAEASVAQPTDH
ncbi:Fur family transcriptional regulator [Cryobacterium tepidiphilum]|uniref:Transcriptional repressor n=1 Tax=Cryobacterium tepidiphilum TaxID=2486026 RepID=A0A3M8LDT6_9MICO|nr:Fur family transcriptional regulator [Cryobacterium tepidiphilum]RNE63600.1 transcriptional repressor [Cryobacterium tepidiphilum]